MYITAEELRSVLYEYQITEITEDDETITDDAIASAEAEVRSYFEAANARRETAGLNQQQYASWVMYDIDAIFSKTGSQRNAFLKRLIMRIAAYNLCELAQVDVLNDKLLAQHDSTIATLEKIAGTGDYKNARIIISGLPTITPTPGTETSEKPFRMTSRKKFTHNF